MPYTGDGDSIATFQVQYNFVQPADVTFTSSPPGSVQVTQESDGSLSVVGIAETAPGSPVTVQAMINGRQVVGQSVPFAVCAHPDSVTMSYIGLDQPAHPPDAKNSSLWGAIRRELVERLGRPGRPLSGTTP